jgi:Ca2+-binding EF-hand superfamily protein
MTTHFPTKEECAALWSKFDYNGNGILSLAELDKAVSELWPGLDHKPAIMRAYKAADNQQKQQESGSGQADRGDGFLQKKEFRFFLGIVHYYNALWTLFEVADADADRKLTKPEFVRAASALGVQRPEQVFEVVDSNHGGVVLFDEFCTWLARNKIDE